MSINGTLTKTDDDAYTGWVAGLTFDTEITLIDMNGGSVRVNAMQDTNGEDGEYTIFPWAAE